MLEHSQLAVLLTGKNDPLWICNVPVRVRDVLGCSTGAVYLSKDLAAHILSEHNDIDTFEILILPIAIEKGRLVVETARPHFINSIYKHSENTIYFVAMKIAQKGHELWVSSMYKITNKKLVKKLKKCKDL